MLIPCFPKFDLFSKDVILIPINHNNSHWTAAAINFRTKRIESYDSMGMARSTVHKVPTVLSSSLWDLAHIFQRRCAGTWTTSTATRRGNLSISQVGLTGWMRYVAPFVRRAPVSLPRPQTTPQQENGYDCGVFTCQFLQAISRGEEDDFGFSQVDMPYLRRRMIWEIGNAKLRDDP
jgi:sentrin-specific protease 1